MVLNVSGILLPFRKGHCKTVQPGSLIDKAGMACKLSAPHALTMPSTHDAQCTYKI